MESLNYELTNSNAVS